MKKLLAQILIFTFVWTSVFSYSLAQNQVVNDQDADSTDTSGGSNTNNQTSGSGSTPGTTPANRTLFVTTDPATSVDDTSALLRGRVWQTAGLKTTVYFRYSRMERSPVFCNEIYGTDMVVTPDIVFDPASTHSFSYKIEDLKPDTEYYYCAIASDIKNIAYGTNTGNDLVQKFRTLPCETCDKTTITTLDPKVLSATRATLRGSYGSTVPVKIYFQYKKTSISPDEIQTSISDDEEPSLEAFSWTETTKENRNANTYGKYNFTIRNLVRDSTYSVRAVAEIGTGATSQLLYGETKTFKTKKTDSLSDSLGLNYVPEDLPNLNYPPLDFPDLNLPPFDFPDLNLPPFDLSGLGGLDLSGLGLSGIGIGNFGLGGINGGGFGGGFAGGGIGGIGNIGGGGIGGTGGSGVGGAGGSGIGGSTGGGIGGGGGAGTWSYGGGTITTTNNSGTSGSGNGVSISGGGGGGVGVWSGTWNNGIGGGTMGSITTPNGSTTGTWVGGNGPNNAIFGGVSGMGTWNSTGVNGGNWSGLSSTQPNGTSTGTWTDNNGNTGTWTGTWNNGVGNGTWTGNVPPNGTNSGTWTGGNGDGARIFNGVSGQGVWTANGTDGNGIPRCNWTGTSSIQANGVTNGTWTSQGGSGTWLGLWDRGLGSGTCSGSDNTGNTTGPWRGSEGNGSVVLSGLSGSGTWTNNPNGNTATWNGNGIQATNPNNTNGTNNNPTSAENNGKAFANTSGLGNWVVTSTNSNGTKVGTWTGTSSTEPNATKSGSWIDKKGNRGTWTGTWNNGVGNGTWTGTASPNDNPFGVWFGQNENGLSNENKLKILNNTSGIGVWKVTINNPNGTKTGTWSGTSSTEPNSTKVGTWVSATGNGSWTGTWRNGVGSGSWTGTGEGMEGVWIGRDGRDSLLLNTFLFANTNANEVEGENEQELTIGSIAEPPNDAIVRYKEGVETVFARQIRKNTRLAQRYGYTEDMDLERFSWYLAHIFSKDFFGYVDRNGREIRVSRPDVSAYELRQIGNRLFVYEYYKNVIIDIRSITTDFKVRNAYEYYFFRRRR